MHFMHCLTKDMLATHSPTALKHPSHGPEHGNESEISTILQHNTQAHMNRDTFQERKELNGNPLTDLSAFQSDIQILVVVVQLALAPVDSDVVIGQTMLNRKTIRRAIQATNEQNSPLARSP